MAFVCSNDLTWLADEFKVKGYYPYQDEWEDIKREINDKRPSRLAEILPTYEMMSYSAQQFADITLDRFINGTSIAGVPYTGEQLFYLNVVQIERVKKLASKKGGKGIGVRVADFPKFWDEDYKYFTTCDIARWGIGEDGNRIAAYRELCSKSMDLGLVEGEDNLAGGLSHVWLKPRGVGASWKGATWNAYNLFLVPDTQNFIFALTNNYLADKDGIFMKFMKIRDFIQSNCWFLRKNFWKASPTDKTYATGLKLPDDTIQGFNSSVSGVVTDGNTDVARGKRGNATFEEFGTFTGVAETWEKYYASINEYGVSFAQARGFGTGGDKDARYEDLEKMFRDPASYFIIKFKNVYEEGGSVAAMFTPSYINITDTDACGNSQKEFAKAKQDEQRELKKAADDPSILTTYCAEFPYEPNEAFNASGVNILPVELAKQALNRLKITNIDRKVVAYGKLEAIPNRGVRFIPTEDKPYEAFPVKNGHDTESCVCILHQPYRDPVTGLVPENLYSIVIDPYSQAESTDSPSVGDIRVIENINGITRTKGDIVVAWYRGRPKGPKGQDKLCEILYNLAELYNAKIGIENDQPGEVISYGRIHNDTKGKRFINYLEGQFTLNIDTPGGKIVSTKGTKRVFGMHMTADRKEEGMLLYKNWLETPRTVIEENGVERVIRNIDMIMCRAMLEEIIQYRGQNVDSISCMLIGMYYKKELQYQKKKATRQREVDNFYNIELF